MKSYNIRFPIVDDNETKKFLETNQTTKDSFSSNLLLLLLTEKGERYYDPDYGTNLLKFIFEPNDALTQTDIEQEIKRTVSTYIPPLSIKSIKFTEMTDEDDGSYKPTGVNVHIDFIYSEDAFSESGELDLNF